MTKTQWEIPPTMLQNLQCIPSDRAVAILLRHSVRAELPPDDVVYELPLTATGYNLALELGKHLRGRLQTLRASPLRRCMQTAEALAAGAETTLNIVEDRLLGDPGVFVIDDQLAWEQWQKLGQRSVMRHLLTKTEPLPGMAKPDQAAQRLLLHMMESASDTPGIHIFVTHDSILTTTAARALGVHLDLDHDWPDFLEGVFFWVDDENICTSYRDYRSQNPECLMQIHSSYRGESSTPPDSQT